jgi:hypothetical protein
VLTAPGGLWDLEVQEFLSLTGHIDETRKKRAAQRAAQEAREREESRGR